jgi:hypothetical protein
VDLHQAKILQEEQKDQLKNSENKRKLHQLQEFISTLPNEIINVIKKTHRSFDLSWLMTNDRTDQVENPRTNPTEFRTESFDLVNDSFDESASQNTTLTHTNSDAKFQIPKELPSSEINDRKIELSCRILNERAKLQTIKFIV